MTKSENYYSTEYLYILQKKNFSHPLVIFNPMPYFGFILEPYTHSIGKYMN